MPARVLVVEDNLTNLDLMTYLLQSFGHTVLSATDGVGVVDLVRKERPDLVICDIQLPTVKGDEVVGQIKSDDTVKSIPVLAVTAYAMVGDRERLMSKGFDGYISKPIEPESFLAYAESFLQAEKRSAPLHQAQSIEPAVPKPVASSRVLVVDDRSANIDFLRSLLESSGFEVLAAEDHEAAIALAKRHRLDLVICDVHLGQQSGYEVLKALRRDPALRTIPCIMTSSTDWNSAAPAEALAQGARAFIRRPIDPQDLLGQIRELLGG